MKILKDQNYRHYLYAGIRLITLIVMNVLVCASVSAQGVKASKIQAGKKISPDLFGLFFEDINYSADGGLYGELVQNRSFEYSPTDRREWHSFSF